MGRPALARTDDGGWRLDVCSATPGSKHWWIDALDADEAGRFDEADARTVFPRRRRRRRQGPDPFGRFLLGVVASA
jgi:hypothetical protein